MARYNPKETEPRWRKAWADADAFRAVIDPARPKYYVLSMFPYPSGRLHMGHVRNYAIGDALARYMRLQGFNVLQPMGWDDFCLPPAMAVRANVLPPARCTRENIAYMKNQLQALGFGLYWSRDLATCDP